MGWSEKKEASIQTYNKGSKYTINKNTILYAVWSLNSYNLTVNPNNGEEASVYTLKYIRHYNKVKRD